MCEPRLVSNDPEALKITVFILTLLLFTHLDRGIAVDPWSLRSLPLRRLPLRQLKKRKGRRDFSRSPNAFGGHLLHFSCYCPQDTDTLEWGILSCKHVLRGIGGENRLLDAAALLDLSIAKL